MTEIDSTQPLPDPVVDIAYMDVSCDECGVQESIQQPTTDDQWYGVNVDGVHIRLLTWNCSNGHVNHIQKEEDHG